MAAFGRKQLHGGMLNVASIGAVLAGMAAIDDTFRGALVGILQGNFANELTIPAQRVQHITRIVTSSISAASANHVPLVGFAIAGVVLFLLMFRL